MPKHTDDVRMSGFRARSTVEEAWEWLDLVVAEVPVVIEQVQLDDAHGRLLAVDISSAMDVPGFDRSAMDGYAVFADETNGASDYNPIRQRIVGESFPGHPFAGRINPGHAVRIMTGAPIPDGATAVVPAEYTSQQGDEVLISCTVGAGKHIGRTGEDISQGTQVLAAGRRLRPQDIAVIASLGISEVTVRRKPRVRIVITGNELVRQGSEKTRYQIYEANSFILKGSVPRDGGVLESVLYVADDETAIRNALTADGADVVLISGGSSVGAEDYAPLIVAQAGELPIHGVAMRPSSPTGLGRLGKTICVLLPGNPVSCLCAYDFFAARAIRQLAGFKANWPYHRRVVRLSRKIVSDIGRTDYCRVQLKDDLATPLAISGASILSSTTRADGFVVIPPESEGLPEGSEVEIWLYDA